jgi:hypothetical protein
MSNRVTARQRVAEKRALPAKAKQKKKARPRVEKPKTDHRVTVLELESLAHMLTSAPDGMTQYQTFQAGWWLRRLAESPAALDAMRPAAAPGRPDTNGERNYKAVLDYVLTLERVRLAKLGNSKLARAEVCGVWGLGPTVLRDAITGCLKSPHWNQWADIERKTFALGNPNLKGVELLAATSKAIRPQVIP